MDYHYPVMVKEVEKYIGGLIDSKFSKQPDSTAPGSSGIVIFDGTLGHAGHLLYIMNLFSDYISSYIATDADQRMFDVASERIKQGPDGSVSEQWLIESKKISLYNCSYVRLGEIAQELGVLYDVVFLDLGVNLWHFKQHERGFSIKGEGDLDMRYNQNGEKMIENGEKWGKIDETSEMTAADILNTYSEKQLIDMFVLNSEISVDTSTKIAEEIVRMRKNKLWKTSTELNKLTMKLNYSARVAAIVFQALRIEVNKEFQNIKSCIQTCEQVMKPGGILMVLSYHSAEDRIIKEMMKGLKEAGVGEIVTKNAIPPNYHETIKNKPSRSARLRVFRFTGKQEQ